MNYCQRCGNLTQGASGCTSMRCYLQQQHYTQPQQPQGNWDGQRPINLQSWEHEQASQFRAGIERIEKEQARTNAMLCEILQWIKEHP